MKNESHSEMFHSEREIIAFFRSRNLSSNPIKLKSTQFTKLMGTNNSTLVLSSTLTRSEMGVRKKVMKSLDNLKRGSFIFIGLITIKARTAPATLAFFTSLETALNAE